MSGSSIRRQRVWGHRRAPGAEGHGHHLPGDERAHDRLGLRRRSSGAQRYSVRRHDRSAVRRDRHAGRASPARAHRRRPVRRRLPARHLGVGGRDRALRQAPGAGHSDSHRQFGAPAGAVWDLPDRRRAHRAVRAARPDEPRGVHGDGQARTRRGRALLEPGPAGAQLEGAARADRRLGRVPHDRGGGQSPSGLEPLRHPCARRRRRFETPNRSPGTRQCSSRTPGSVRWRI